MRQTEEGGIEGQAKLKRHWRCIMSVLGFRLYSLHCEPGSDALWIESAGSIW